MPEHLSGERLSALLDDDDPTAPERRHLEACSECENELHRLRRMRMALSALGELEAPAEGWDRISSALPADVGAAGRRGTDRSYASDERAAGGQDGPSGWSFAGAWARAAAAVLLFAGGLALGSHLSGPSGDADRAATTAASDRARPAASAVESGGASGAASPTSGAEAAAGLADLGTAGSTALEAYRDPAAAAERLARLDAMMQAAREAVREDPTDPAMNDLLFQVAEDRQALIDALHLATLEYR